MSDIKLFSIDKEIMKEKESSQLTSEKQLQNLVEANLEEILAIRFLASEFSTGANHGGRTDSLGIDENNSAVIIEYKLSTNQNAILQGL